MGSSSALQIAAVAKLLSPATVPVSLCEVLCVKEPQKNLYFSRYGDYCKLRPPSPICMHLSGKPILQRTIPTPVHLWREKGRSGPIQTDSGDPSDEPIKLDFGVTPASPSGNSGPAAALTELQRCSCLSLAHSSMWPVGAILCLPWWGTISCRGGSRVWLYGGADEVVVLPRVALCWQLFNERSRESSELFEERFSLSARPTDSSFHRLRLQREELRLQREVEDDSFGET